MARSLTPEEARAFDEALSNGNPDGASEETPLSEMLKRPEDSSDLSPLSVWLAAQLSDPRSS